MSTQHIICEKIGCCGVITLDRPQALNALTLDMVTGLAAALDSYAADREIASVVIRSNNPRAFCAGGDIKQLYELGRAGKQAEQMAFFAAEYRLCRQISLFPKPYVALVDGIAMGGGAGISLHGTHRVAGEALAFAMPEVGIGFFPDVGGTYFLPRLPGRFGTYLALTGAPIGLADALGLGLMTAHVPAARFDALLTRLSKGENVDAAIAAESAAAPDSALLKQKHFVDGCFAAPSVAAILEEIDEASYAGSAFGMATFETIQSRSPTSLSIALRQMQLGPTLDLEAALRLEYRIADRVTRGHDYAEGVRAVLIDKDRKPNWDLADIEKIKSAEIDAYFAPLAEGELEFSALAGAA
ncbi:MAG: enoyl-CoA hydratase/isomerase family protein [Methylovirgula sp.]